MFDIERLEFAPHRYASDTLTPRPIQRVPPPEPLETRIWLPLV